MPSEIFGFNFQLIRMRKVFKQPMIVEIYMNFEVRLLTLKHLCAISIVGHAQIISGKYKTSLKIY